MNRIIFLIVIWISAFVGMALSTAHAQEFGQADKNFVPTYGTETSSSGSATLNTQSGVITSEALSAGPGSFEQITLNDELIGTGSIILVTVYNETNVSGIPVPVLTSQGSGSVVFRIYNAHNAEPFSGTVRIYFLILK